jgi:hypothetical protein
LTPVRLLLSCDAGLRKVLVEAVGDLADRALAQPLVQVLRRRPPWPGPGRLEIRVNYPSGLAAAFAPGTAVTTVEQLENVAAVVWYAIDGGTLLLEWQRQTRQAISDALLRRSREQPQLPFA